MGKLHDKLQWQLKKIKNAMEQAEKDKEKKDADFLKQIIKETGNEYASLVADGVEAGDVDTFIDTGSHIQRITIRQYTWWYIKQDYCSCW